MVIVYFKKSGSRYQIRLTDGYIRAQQQPKWLRSPPWSDLPPEKGMVELLYRRNKALHLPLEWPYRPRVVQTWVIGEQAWLKQPVFDPIRRTVEEDQSDDYRIVIIGLAYEFDDRHYPSRIQSSVYDAGIKLKRHEDNIRFNASATEVLKAVAEQSARTRLPTGDVLDDLRVPYVFRGDIESKA